MSTSTPLTEEQQALVIEHEKFARNVSAKTAAGLPQGAVFNVDEAIGYGKMGLIEAAQRFNFAGHDEDRATLDKHFRSYAFPRIRGAVIDASRRLSFGYKRNMKEGEEVDVISYEEFEEAGVLQLSARETDLDLAIDFKMALTKLTDKERKIVLAMGAGVTAKEIGDQLGVGQTRISQIASEAKKKLRKEMEFSAS